MCEVLASITFTCTCSFLGLVSLGLCHFRSWVDISFCSVLLGILGVSGYYVDKTCVELKLSNFWVKLDIGQMRLIRILYGWSVWVIGCLLPYLLGFRSSQVCFGQFFSGLG